MIIIQGKFEFESKFKLDVLEHCVKIVIFLFRHWTYWKEMDELEYDKFQLNQIFKDFKTFREYNIEA